MERLRRQLRSIDRKSYKAYKEIEGAYRFTGYDLCVDHVQGDPFATPSRVSVRVPMDLAGLPGELWGTETRRVACEDFVARAVRRAIGERVRGGRGTGHSGEVKIHANAQQVLVRNALIVTAAFVEARLTVGLPARGRRTDGRAAEVMFFEELPGVVEAALIYRNLDGAALAAHVQSVEDQDHLRRWLDAQGLAAFVSDGAVLPRRSGIDDRPLREHAVRFRAPDSLAHAPVLPNAGPVRGMGIPRGVTLIVGGGFHGKSTLLHALERGVYDHVPGDGRERVVTDPTAVKVRAEDGRAVSGVDISPFIDRLPFGRDTRRFSTQNASGSTSQAANIIEALETGSRLLLIDEDTCATNFMIRDARMQRLVAREKEPITPLLHRVRELYKRCGVSTVLVMGGSGDYFEAADTVIMMDTYAPEDVTAEARSLAGAALSELDTSGLAPICAGCARRPRPSVLDPSRGRHAVKIDVKRREALSYGDHAIDLANVEQLLDKDQTRAVGWMTAYYARHLGESGDSLVGSLRKILDVARRDGLDVFAPYKRGDLAMPRLHEVAAAINRIREGEWD